MLLRARISFAHVFNQNPLGPTAPRVDGRARLSLGRDRMDRMAPGFPAAAWACLVRGRRLAGLSTACLLHLVVQRGSGRFSLKPTPRVRQVILGDRRCSVSGRRNQACAKHGRAGDPVYRASCIGVGKGMKWSEEELKALEGGFARGCRAGGSVAWRTLMSPAQELQFLIWNRVRPSVSDSYSRRGIARASPRRLAIRQVHNRDVLRRSVGRTG